MYQWQSEMTEATGQVMAGPSAAVETEGSQLTLVVDLRPCCWQAMWSLRELQVMSKPHAET